MLDKTLIRNLVIATAVTFVAVSVPGSQPTLQDVIDMQLAEVSARPSDPTVRNDLGNLLVLVERYEEAEAAYRRGLEIDPGNEALRFNLSLLLQQSGRFGEARNELKALLEVSPNHAWAHYQLGTLLSMRGDRKAAVESYALSFAIDPTLSFPSNNPHIIDNRLATEALLRSSYYSRSVADQMPRAYAEAGRIRGLMMTEDQTTAESVVDDGLRNEEEMPLVTGAARPQRGFPTTGTDASLPPANADDEPVAEGNRVLTNESLSGLGNIGQSTGDNSRPSAAERFGSRPRVDRSNSRTTDRQTAAEKRRNVQRPGTASQGQDPLRGRVIGGTGTSANSGTATNPSTRRYRPSRRSSAQLQLELLDENEADTRIGIGP